MRIRLIALFACVAACLPLSDSGRADPAPPSDQAAAVRASATPPAPSAARTSRPSPVVRTSPARGVQATCPEPAAIAKKLQARYDTTSAFRADFRQETTISALGESEEAVGTVAFKKPGKMRWEFHTPEKQTIVSDGATLWIHQPADRQVLKAPFQAAFVSTTPVSFLVGVGRITDDFRAERDRRGCSAGRIHVQLVPKNTQDLGSLTVALDPATFDIVEAAVTDPIGNTTRLTFANVERNATIPDGEFHFEVPPGVDVVNAPGVVSPSPAP